MGLPLVPRFGHDADTEPVQVDFGHARDFGWYPDGDGKGREAMAKRVEERIAELSRLLGGANRCFKTRTEIEYGGLSEGSRIAQANLATFPDVSWFWLYPDGHIEPYDGPSLG